MEITTFSMSSGLKELRDFNCDENIKSLMDQT